MTTTITLDRPALRWLIDKDPEFALQLKAAVLSEIACRFFEKDARRIIEAAEPEMFKKAVTALQATEDGTAFVRKALEAAVLKRSNHWSDYVVPTDAVKAVIYKEVTKARDLVVAEAIAATNEEIKTKIEKHLSDINTDDRIERRVSRLTDEYIEQRVKELFDKRLAQIAAAT